MTVFEVIRDINIVLSVLVVMGLCMTMRAVHSLDGRLIRIGLIGVLISNVYASVNFIMIGVPAGVRNVVILAPLVWLTAAVVVLIQRRWRRPKAR